MEAANRTGPVHYRTAAVGGVNVSYREAGPDSAPVVLLLHGFPSRATRITDRAAGAARPRTPGRHGGEPERADRGAAALIDRSHRVEPNSVSLTRELIIEALQEGPGQTDRRI